jgi:hypothetical protein
MRRATPTAIHPSRPAKPAGRREHELRRATSSPPMCPGNRLPPTRHRLSKLRRKLLLQTQLLHGDEIAVAGAREVLCGVGRRVCGIGG